MSVQFYKYIWFNVISLYMLQYMCIIYMYLNSSYILPFEQCFSSRKVYHMTITIFGPFFNLICTSMSWLPLFSLRLLGHNQSLHRVARLLRKHVKKYIDFIYVDLHGCRVRRLFLPTSWLGCFSLRWKHDGTDTFIIEIKRADKILLWKPRS